MLAYEAKQADWHWRFWRVVCLHAVLRRRVMDQTTAQLRRLESAIHSQYLESLDISESECQKLREFLQMGLTEEQGIVAIKQWLNCHDSVQQQSE